MLKKVMASLVLSACLGVPVSSMALPASPTTKTAAADLSAPENSVVYKRKQVNNAYPMAASSYENDFLKSMMGVGMQTPSTHQTAGRA